MTLLPLLIGTAKHHFSWGEVVATDLSRVCRFPALFIQVAARLSAITSTGEDALVQLAHPCLHPLLYVLEQLSTSSPPADDVSYQLLLQCLQRLRHAPILAVRKMIATTLLDFACESPAWMEGASVNAVDTIVHMLHAHVTEVLAEPDAERLATKLTPAVLTACEVGSHVLDASRPLASQAVWLSTASCLIRRHSSTAIPAELVALITASLDWPVVATPSYEYFAQERAAFLCTRLFSQSARLQWTAVAWRATLATRESFAAVMDVLEDVLRLQPTADGSAVFSQLISWLKTTDLKVIDTQLNATCCLSLLSSALATKHLTADMLDPDWLATIAMSSPRNGRLHEAIVALAGSVVSVWPASAFHPWLATVVEWSHWEKDPALRGAAAAGLCNAVLQDTTALLAEHRATMLLMLLHHLFAEEAELRLLTCTAVAKYLKCGLQLNTLLAKKLIGYLVEETVMHPALHTELWTYFDRLLNEFQPDTSVYCCALSTIAQSYESACRTNCLSANR